MNTLRHFEALWSDDPESHLNVYNIFTEKVNRDWNLKGHRDYIEIHSYGFGDRPLHWMWYLLVHDLVQRQVPVRFLEIGVHRGQILSLVDMLLSEDMFDVVERGLGSLIVGVSTYDGTADEFSHYQTGKDYRQDVLELFKMMNDSREPIMIKGNSMDAGTIESARALGPYSLVFIDGGHDSSTVRSDLINYSAMLEPGGYLVCDDCCNYQNMPMGWFNGHHSVSDVVDQMLPPRGSELSGFTHVGSVCHNRIFRKN